MDLKNQHFKKIKKKKKKNKKKKNKKKKKKKKKKKRSVDIIVLKMCTINDIHMMYGSRDMECD